MKKIISLLVSISILLSLTAAVWADAEETECVLTYSGKVSVGLWLNQFDEDGKCIGEAAVAFSTAAGFDAVVFQNLWAGKAENGEDPDVKFEVFKFDTDFATSEAAQPLFSETRHFDGDQAPKYKKDADGKDLLDENGNKIVEQQYGVTLELGKVLEAGQYVLKVSEIAEIEDGVKPYAVIPNVTESLSNAYLLFESKEFGFGLRFVKSADGNYFKKLDGREGQLEIIAEEIADRDKEGHPVSFKTDMVEFGILTPVIPENKALTQFIFSGSPTWNNQEGNSDVGYEVFVWDEDYEKTVTDKTPLHTGVIRNHQDNQSLTLPLELSCFAGRQYLILVYCDDDGNCGYYPTTPDADLGGFTFFADGEEDKVANPAFQLGWSTVDESMKPADPTPKPTPAPTAEPATEPTKAPTTDPTAAPTTAPESSGCGSMAAGGAVIVAAAAMLLLKKKD